MPPYENQPGLVVALDDRGVLHLTLDRPAKRNALNDEMVNALTELIDAAGRDEAVRVISLGATGEHFCSGFDLASRNSVRSERKPRVGSIQRRLPSQVNRLCSVMLTVQTPIVATARGWAAGIGVCLLLAADFAVVADDARIWEPFVERGFTPDSGTTWMLPARIGEVRARELLMLGRKITGREAADWGMVHAAVAAESVDAVAAEVIETLAVAATVSVGLTKWLLHNRAATDLDGQLRAEGFAMELSSRSDDFKEGLAAFAEKRPPDYTGR